MQLFLLLLLISFLPLANFTYYYFSYEFGKYLVFLLISSLLLLLQGIRLFKKKENINKPIPLILFLLVYFVSTIFSINPLVSFFGYYGSFTGGFIYILLLSLIFYTAYIFRKDKDLILKTIFLSGIAVSLIGIWQYINHAFRIYSTIGQPNRLAFFLLAIIPIGLFLYLNEKRKWYKVGYFFGELTVFMAFFLTFSRSSYIVLVILLLLMIKEIKKSKLFLSSILIGLIVFGVIFIKTLPSTISHFQKSSLSLRLAEWQGSWGAVRHRNFLRQLIGYGPETVYYTFFKYRPVIYNTSLEELGVGPNQIRNYYLHLLSGVGVLGLMTYIFWIIKINYLAFKKNKGVFYSLLGILFMSFFYYQTDTVLVLFWVLAGLVYE